MYVEFMFVGRNPIDFKKLMRGAQPFEISITQLMMGSVGARDRAHICALLDWVD